MNLGKYFNSKGSSSDDDFGGGPFNDKGKKRQPVYEFDPSGLERAAASARELRDNPHAVKILENRALELRNRNTELLNEQKSYELKIEQTKNEGVKQQQDYSVDILREEAKTHRTKAEYEDFLARERNKDRMKLEAKSHEELLKTQEESVKRQEELRKQTIDYEYKKKAEMEKDFAINFWKNKAVYKNETKEISLSKAKLYQDSVTERLKIMSDAFIKMASGTFKFFYDDKMNFVIAVGGVCFASALWGITRGSVSIGMRLLDSYVSNPKLLRVEKIRKYPLFRSNGRELTPKFFEEKGLFYNSQTQKSLMEVVQSTGNLRLNRGYMRNYLFYGPPGTGKTLFAQKLAECSGMDYGILTGGDVIPLKENGVFEMQKVFRKCKTSNGIILFLDEADAFLKKRDKYEIGENMRGALNSFLYDTSSASKNLMLILATNKPEQLDSAVTDRVDSIIEFPLPDAESRAKLFGYYIDQFVKKEIIPVGYTFEEIIPILVNESQGLSAREISKLCLTFHAIGLSNSERKLPKDIILEKVREMSKQHGKKVQWDGQFIS